ncbi:MAG: recombinase family protein [Candidatus Thiodiazotropha sp. (ex Dulcina madagascariensis)]|nr:recombinase family protein [Candidatus Thiodiazotropha sp. (ex Dulcina madagascariensis)]
MIELCRIYDTLLGDAEHIYNPNLMDDQLILGIKGTLSVVELGVLKLRMQQGKEAKAKRGELYGSMITPGYQLDTEGNLVKDPNRRVQEIIELIFKMFGKLGSARKTHRWFHDNQVEVPVNKAVAGHFQLIWKYPSLCYLRDVINNPFYAGVYYYGRRANEIVMRDGMPHRRQANYLDPDKIKVFIRDHHAGYISWQTYEAQRAFEQYDRVDPANRLVAETLEKRWNEKLKALEYTRSELAHEQAQAKSITDQDKDNILALGKNFSPVWRDKACPMSLKKRLVRLLINEIVVDIDEQHQQLHFIIRWQGGCHSEFMLERPRSAAQAHKTDKADLEIIQAMAPKYDDMAIARVLASLGRTTGKGRKWSRRSVAYIRRRYGLGPCDPQALAGTTTLVQAAKQCGISDGSIKRLIDAKILSATQVAPYAPIEIKQEDLDSEIVQQHIQTLKRTGKLSIEGTIMDNQKSLFE